MGNTWESLLEDFLELWAAQDARDDVTRDAVRLHALGQTMQAILEKLRDKEES